MKLPGLVDMNYQVKYGHSSLRYALDNDNDSDRDLARLLLDHGANPNTLDK
jgi:ankyrin repeat protein